MPYQNEQLLASEKINASYDKINRNSDEVEKHVEGTDSKHAAKDITFNSARPTITADDVLEAVEQVDERVDALVNNPDPNKDLELVDFRTSSIYGAFATAKERGDNIDVRFSNLKIVNVEDYGAVGDGVTDDAAAIIAAVAAGDIIYFPKYHYVVTEEILMVHGQSIVAPNGLLLDGSSFVGSGGGDSVLKVENDGSDFIVLPALSVDPSKEDLTLTFSTAHGLSVDDIICLYDDTDYSWSSSRPSYKKSEFCRVAQVVSTTEVLLDNPLYDSYDPSVNVNFGAYKMNMGTFNIIGSIEVIQGKLGAYYGVRFIRTKDLNIHNIKAQALGGSYVAISLTQCYNTQLYGTAIQETLSGLGGDYGLSIANCQHVIAAGYFSASRHGVTHGGFDGVGAVITRDSKVSGVIKTNSEGLVPAADCHGNCEDITFEGTIYGGLVYGGKNIKARATIYGDNRGLCIQSAEVRSFNHDFSYCKLITDKDPKTLAGGRGVFDFGGNTISETDNMESGQLKAVGIELLAPNAGNGFVCRTRNTTVLGSAYKAIDISGANIQIDPTSILPIYIVDTGGAKNFDLVKMHGLTHNGVSDIVINTDEIYSWSQKGSDTITTTTSVNVVVKTITFPKAYSSGYVPTVDLSWEGPSALGQYIGVTVGEVDNTSFNLVIYTIDGSNFAAGTWDFSWESR